MKTTFHYYLNKLFHETIREGGGSQRSVRKVQHTSAKRRGISRSAWIHYTLSRALDEDGG
jgi:hypothetical protein